MSKVDVVHTDSTSDYIFRFFNTMRDNNLIMIYEGEFSQEITKTVLSMAEKNFESEALDSNVKKKIFNVMVEALQNICKHQFTAKNLSNNSALDSAIFTIGLKNENYQIITGNYILNEHINVIKSKVDKINTLDQEGLKQFYKETRLNTTISDVGGAGLGFIDMARKSGQQLIYHFEPIDDKCSFYVLLVSVSSKKEE